MKIENLVVGELRTNCYIVSNEFDEVIIIDPGDEFEKIVECINGRNVIGVLITHSHYDHIGALGDLEKLYGLVHNTFPVSGFDFSVIKTPGHLFDSLSFYFEKDKVMFTGDFLFKGTFGRTDLPGASNLDMIASLSDIKQYPGDIIIYPGHGSSTTLCNEFNNIDNYIEYL